MLPALAGNFTGIVFLLFKKITEVKFPDKLNRKLESRINENAFRVLPEGRNGVDFYSNDYLGLARSAELKALTMKVLKLSGMEQEGSTGSRLISGNHPLYGLAEEELCEFYQAEASLVFNSGYDANVGFFSAVPQRGDVVLYDEFAHASIRDGLSMGLASSYKFKHNDLDHLEVLLKKYTAGGHNCYVVTESVFSMDGDSPDLLKMVELCESYKALPVVDEAHAIGVKGRLGKGMTWEDAIRNRVFARIVTFGKAPGVHGAVILGQQKLKDYLVNFCRSLIYTTALPPHAIAAIIASHRLITREAPQSALWDLIHFFYNKLEQSEEQLVFQAGNSAIATVLLPGNDRVKEVASKLKSEGLEVKPILSPTVPRGKERLRICLHTYNSFEEIERLFDRLITFVNPSISGS